MGQLYVCYGKANRIDPQLSSQGAKGFDAMKFTRTAIPWMALLCVLFSGCATSPYMMDRARDARDIVTLTTGFGCGVKVRTGPVQLGFLHNYDFRGWRNGCFVDGTGSDDYLKDWLLLVFGEDNFGGCDFSRYFMGDDAAKYWEREKGFEAKGVGIGIAHDYFSSSESKRRPLFRPYYSQVEVCSTFFLYHTIRLGVNPGEFVDFLLGWGGIDFFDDDIGLPEKESAPMD